MKFAALISGGKDSFFNVLHCLANDHELVCLANLHPPPSDSHEMDSFMYQTVGFDVVPYYAECTGKPLYRQVIKGSSNNQKLEYEQTQDDETEDLYELLKVVKEHHPDVEAISVGAILSSYQRTRVEDVCSRLGLTALAYLWQRDQEELMGEMVDSDMEARLIKVAAIGLNDSHLGKTLQEMYPVLKNLNRKFGVHVCGEGGEFESLVFDAPFFTKGKLQIVDKQIVRHTNDEIWYLKLKVQLVEKSSGGKCNVVQPPLLHDPFDQISLQPLIKKTESLSHTPHTKVWEQNRGKNYGRLRFNNITSTEPTLEGQVTHIFSQLERFLSESKLHPANIQSSSLLVSDMSNFAQINKIYQTFFTKPLPPARVCVETNLPKECFAQLSVEILDDLHFKKGLHVQGRSYWAPSNIGPYSQSIADTRTYLAHISGQIPLIPRDMTPCKDVTTQSVLALQHFEHVKEVIGSPTNIFICCFVTSPATVPLVTETYRQYIGLQRDRDHVKELVTVVVGALPRGVDVEWGGITVNEAVGDYEEAQIAFGKPLEYKEDRHYKIFAGPDLYREEFPESYEFVPVEQVFDSEAREQPYAVVELV
ncbi:hypothetical protein OGAPHI_006993 [Ogataea philodendri]|uniref:Diphthine--ammonia ligase n=1 Tax=Ogataea philodendri TaxID=1378263 RepID=A0A9P8NVI2_9ASCO|nr:uncharacterized protein OGAPHI_006993 [Ogataea philodendri]KAH3660407.1 hypothetical protein OGAPHI_006993 [Ogataea philodendri]